MSPKSLAILILTAFVISFLPALGQHNVGQGGHTVVPGTVELSFSPGLVGLNQTVMSLDQVIYKFTSEATYWGDVEIKGEVAFNPILRLGYNLMPWLCLESSGGLFFSDFSTDITNRKRRPNEADAPVDLNEPELGQFDAEKGSFNGGNLSINAIIYFLNVSDSRGLFHQLAGGRNHPYISVGAGRVWYRMDSNYTDGKARSNDFNFGGGTRFFFTQNISLRLESLLHLNTVQFTPVDNFLLLDEGTIAIPLRQYYQIEGQYFEQPVESIPSQSLKSFVFSIGIQGSF